MGIGLFFSLLYALSVTLGWAKTRSERRKFQENAGVCTLPAFDLSKGLADSNRSIRCVSLTENQFVDAHDNRIDLSEYDAYIAIGEESVKYPKVKSGFLMLFEKGTFHLKYTFATPALTDYR